MSVKTANVTKSQIINWINEGVTKDKSSPNYVPEVGTLLEKLNCTQSACVQLFKTHPDLEKLYKQINSMDQRAAFISLLEEEEFAQEITPESVIANSLTRV